MPVTTDFSKITVGGPCKITDVSQVIYTEGNVTITPKPVYRDISSSLVTKDDQILIGLTYEIDYTPKSVWSAGFRGALVPSTYTDFAVSGGRIIGNTNRPVTVLGADGEQWVFTRAALTKMPNLFLGLGKSLWGAAQHTAFIGSGKQLTDVDAFVTDGAAGVPGTAPGVWSQTDYATVAGGYQEAVCTAAWGAVAGFITIFAQEGFELQHELEFADVKQGNIVVDKRLVGYRGMVVFKPEGPTTAQLMGKFPGAIGTRLSAGAADLVITGGGISGTLKSAMPFRGKFNFDNKLLRHDEFAFVNALATPGARLAFS